jgi:glucose uptake protein
MILPQSYSSAIVLMCITMLCWGSWANMTKIDKNWRFELFYWDYSLGVFALAVVFALTLGNLGPTLPSFFDNLVCLRILDLLKAITSGIIFNIANILLVAAIALAGMSIAFPLAIGIAVVIGTSLSYWVSSIGNPYLLILGILLIVTAIILVAITYRKKDRQEKGSFQASKKGIIISVISGILMSFFYPILADSIHGNGSLTPYTGFFFLSIGILICTAIVNPILMKHPILGKPISMKMYFQASTKQHLMGIMGGIIWGIGTSFNIIASTNAGPAIAFAMGQGATLIAAIWGVFVWKEFSKVKRVFFLLFLVFICYLLGLISIGLAKIF